jgi:hypothetical protein
MNDYQLVSTEGEFSLWVISPVYKTYKIETGYIRNTKTGENCGKEVKLRKHFYNEAEKLSEPIYDEDCYEFVFEEANK